MTRTSWGEICTLEYGKALRDYVREQTETSCFRVFGTNGPIGWTAQKLSDEAGVIVGRKGAYRGIHFSQDPFFVIDTAYYLRPKDAKLNLKWAYYKLLTVDLDQVDVGAAIPTTNREAFYALPVSIPEPQIQGDIASILSAYDELMETNRRRIRLLENAARLLYQEWFLRLRFPGHEHTPITHGLPRGWQKQPLEALCSDGDGIQTGPFGSQLHQADYTNEGLPVVMPKDIIDFRISTESIARIPEALADKLGRHRMNLGDIVYGRRGDIGRRAFISRRQSGWFCGTGCLRIRPNAEAVNPRYLFDTLGSPDTAGTIANRAKGSTMLNLSAGALTSVPVVVAPRVLQDTYAEQADSISGLAENLALQNQKLRAACDLLLPRLMSGEIEV